MATGYIWLPFGAADVPDDTAGNEPMAVVNSKGGSAAPHHFREKALADATTKEMLMWSGVYFPGDAAATPSVIFKVMFAMATATTGTIEVAVRVLAHTPGDAQDIDTDNWAAQTVSGGITVPATLGRVGTISVTPAAQDGIAADDFFAVWFAREVDGADTAAGDTEFLAARLDYTTT